MARGREFKVGLFVVLMTAALYIGFNYLRGLDVFSPLNTYYVKYQNISGLDKGARIILSGLDVGSVVDRKFSDDTYSEIIITLAIDKTIILTDSTIAKLAKPDFLGGSEIQLLMRPGGARVLEAGDTLRSEVDGGIAELLVEEGQTAANALSALVNKINDVLDPFVETSDTLKYAINNFSTLSGELVLTTQEAKSTLEQFKLQMDYVADSLVAAMGGLDPLLREYQMLGEKLNAVDIDARLVKMDSLLDGTQTFLERLNSDEGTLGQLMTNDSLYNNLNLMMSDLDSLLIDFRYNPKRYVHFSIFGRKNRPPADGRSSAKKKKKDR